MVELVDTYALGAYAARCAGSNPVPGTTLKSRPFGLNVKTLRLSVCYQGIAQLVARSVRDAEVAGSSPATLTTGVGAVVARTSGGREVASSILVPPTKIT